MFVNHLRDSIAEQNDILIKRFNLSLQFDAIDQINRDWHMLATQGVEKWILQELTFIIAHDIFRVQKLMELHHTTGTFSGL
ncbi:MAG: hypothetical protein JWR68_33 [Polaromonas sp.]|nr:hypothetical protein [Polaromonas sp.]